MDKAIGNIYKAEGDPWTYVVYEDGSMVAIDGSGAAKKVTPGSRPAMAIQEQIDSGQLAPILTGDAPEAAEPSEVGQPEPSSGPNTASGKGGDAKIDLTSPLGVTGSRDLGAADRATAGATERAMREARAPKPDYQMKRDSLIDEALGSLRDGASKGAEYASKAMSGDDEEIIPTPLRKAREERLANEMAEDKTKSADEATSWWEQQAMERKRAQKGN